MPANSEASVTGSRRAGWRGTATVAMLAQPTMNSSAAAQYTQPAPSP